MSPIPDHRLMRLARAGMISPFMPEKVREVEGKPAISFGLGSYGYDFTVGHTFKIPNPEYKKALDPKKFDPKAWITTEVKTGAAFTLPSHSFALTESLEYFKIPRSVLALVLGKSTYARSGLIANFTPLEPEWEGYITIELGNLTPLPILIYAGEGIAQAVFFEGDPPAKGYSTAGGGGTYQNQRGITHSKVSEKLG